MEDVGLFNRVRTIVGQIPGRVRVHNTVGVVNVRRTY